MAKLDSFLGDDEPVHHGGSNLQKALEERHLDRSLAEIDRFFERCGVNLQSEFLLRLVVPDPSRNELVVADVGCGRGNAIEQAHRMIHLPKYHMRSPVAIKTIGVDKNLNIVLSSETLSQNAELGLGNEVQSEFRQGDAIDLPLEDNSVDVLYSSNTLYYVVDSLKALEEGYRAIKPGGVAMWQVSLRNLGVQLDFADLIRKTPGADRCFSVSIDPNNPDDAIIVCKKNEGDTFAGFNARVLREVGYDIKEVVQKHPRSAYFRTAVYDVVGDIISEE